VWLRDVLRPIFMDQLPDVDAYTAEFEQTEVLLGALAQDMANIRAKGDPNGRSWVLSRWYGLSVGSSSRGYSFPVADLVHEFDTQGLQWAPLKIGLFGGEEARARDALDKFQAEFDRIAGHRFL
jgi:hypothetical protein